ncbi:MAG: helix-turn-helix domain-containing protein [Elusimicrobiota bacterium]|jgi:hypothetical protein
MPDRDPLRRIPPKTVPSTIDVDVGSILKEARLKKGQAVDVVSQHTRVPKKLIEALEANRLDEFPAMVYLRGFLHIYCDYLEVDFDPLWKKINPDRPVPAEAEPAGPASPAPAPRAAAPAPAAPRAAAPGSSREPAGDPRRILALLALALAGAGLAAWLLLRQGAPQAPEGSVEAPAPPPVLQPISVPVDPLVTLSFKEDVWVRVTIDDRIRFEGIAPRGGKPQEYRPKLKVSIRTPSPEHLVLTLNGAPTSFPAVGPSGEHVLPVR